MENKLKEKLSWIFGISLSFFGFVGVMASDFIPGLALLIIGMILIPPIVKFIERKWNFRLTIIKKIIIVVVGFFIFGLSINSPEINKNQTQPAEQKTTETKSETNQSEASAVKNEIPTQEPAKLQDNLYPVLKVVDGDTVAVEIDGKEQVLRLIGINTPETVDPRKPVQCFGAEASAKSKEVLIGKKVKVEADETQSNLDKYGRPLRYIYLEDGINFNKMMIEEGYAYEYTYDVPYKYQSDFKESEKEAKDAKRGLWAENTCNGSLNMPKADTNTTAASSTSKTTTDSSQKNTNSFSGTCAGKRTCGQMTSCQEAYFYLNNCGVGSLDRDKDGIPCETICN